MVTSFAMKKSDDIVHRRLHQNKYMKQIILEIRDAEGGADAKLLVDDMRDIYIKTAKINSYN